MKDFNTYWKEKAQKRRKRWASLSKRYAKQHAQLEEIRQEVLMPLDYVAGIELDNYKVEHYAKSNPIAVWQQWRFEFSESGLREAMAAQGADMSSFKMEVNRQSIVGKDAPHPTRTPYGNRTPNKVFEHERMYLVWLKRIYEICTDVETCKLTFGQISMVIRRYSTDDLPFGYYELILGEQLVRSAMMMQETDFYTLNTATLLMEMAAEYELRHEEMNYHAKKLRIRTMEAVTIEGIDVKLWDKKKIGQKMTEYVEKGYDLWEIVQQVLRPWKSAVKKYIEAISERDKQNPGEKKVPYNVRPIDIKGYLRPYFDSIGLQEVKIWPSKESSSTILFEYKGFQAKYDSCDYLFYPNAHFCDCKIKISRKTTLNAIANYLKMMPVHSQKTDEVVVTASRLYDQTMQQNEEYRNIVKILEPLATQYAGTPVGKMMKYLRWEAGRLKTTKMTLSSIKILNDRAFSFEEKNAFQYIKMPNGRYSSTHKDITYVKWLDPECQNVCAGDPVTTNVEEWIKTHAHKQWSWKVPFFVSLYSSGQPYVSNLLSADFIDQKL